MQEIKLKENIKSVRKTKYKAVEKFSELQKCEEDNREYCLYNDNGNEIEYNWYYSEGNLSKKSTYKYDDKENKIETNQIMQC